MQEMQIAKGEYCTFVDSDDIFSADYLEIVNCKNMWPIFHN